MEVGASFDSPVSLALLLRDHGLDLAAAHAAVTKLAAQRHVRLTVFPADLSILLSRLRGLGLDVRVTHGSA